MESKGKCHKKQYAGRLSYLLRFEVSNFFSNRNRILYSCSKSFLYFPLLVEIAHGYIPSLILPSTIDL
uniref:Ovule protein n=1 Tax=Ascaris lumbricoides TaxID=6252 RepID=A0A0M3HKN3_ASCLU